MFFGYKQQNLKKITAITLAVLFLDQIFKFIVLRDIFFEIEIYKNYNALFGLSINFNLIFVLLVIIFVYYFISKLFENYHFKEKPRNLYTNIYKRLTKAADFSLLFASFKMIKSKPLDRLAIGLILGGIASNLTDRFLYGFIIDYINLFNLFVFNIADLTICFGALLLSWKILKK